jgi:NitT/TauT family transport system substrate-binding protein
MKSRCAAVRALVIAGALLWFAGSSKAEIVIRVGMTNLTTNTVNTGIVLKELKLFEKRLPHSGRYADEKIRIEWFNYTTGPQETNAMLAGRLDFAVMGDYPLVMNAITLRGTTNASRLIATAGFNLQGSGNGIVVHRDSNIRNIRDLVGKTISVPLGSAAHGMLLRALRDNGLREDEVAIVNQGVEVGATNLLERRVDAVAGFVPFPELLPFRGFARKIYDGALSNVPTWHGIVVRDAFADAFPEIVTAYIGAILEANEWIARNPVEASIRIAQWTGVEREVVYLILGPGGIMRLDPVLRPQLVQALEGAKAVLAKTGNSNINDFDPQSWADDQYVRRAFSEAGIAHAPQLGSQALVVPTPSCAHAQADVRESIQLWMGDGVIEAFSDVGCFARAMQKLQSQSKGIAAAYVLDQESHSQAFGQLSYFVVPKGQQAFAITAFARREAADKAATDGNGIVVDFNELSRAPAFEVKR